MIARPRCWGLQDVGALQSPFQRAIACEPNCRADETDGRVHIHALRNLKAGEELFYDYGLVIDERYTPKLKKEYECRCGSSHCRHTMLAPKR